MAAIIFADLALNLLSVKFEAEKNKNLHSKVARLEIMGTMLQNFRNRTCFMPLDILKNKGDGYYIILNPAGTRKSLTFEPHFYSS